MSCLRQYESKQNSLHQCQLTCPQITSKLSGNVQYYPIAPTTKGPYRFQLCLRYYDNQYIPRAPSALPLDSYLRAEVHVVPSEMLVELQGDFGEHLMLKSDSVDQLVSALRRIQPAA